VTSQPLATPNRSPIPALIRKHLVLLLGGIPLALAGIRLVVVSQGDLAVMATLIQTLNLSTVVMYTVTTVGPTFLFYALLALATGGGEWLPRQDKRWRKFWAVGCVIYVVEYLAVISWKSAAWFIGAGAILIVIGVLARRMGVDTPTVALPAVVIGVLFANLLQVGLWLPLERITLTNGNARVGYVLNAADPVTILWREGGLVYLKHGDLMDRQSCNDGSTYGPAGGACPPTTGALTEPFSLDPPLKLVALAGRSTRIPF
jgi:hypothetical protein